MVAQRNGEAGHNYGRGFRAAVTGKGDRDFMAESCEGFRKPFDNVGEAAGFGERKPLGSRKKYPQDGLTGLSPTPKRMFGTPSFYAIRFPGSGQSHAGDCSSCYTVER